MIKRRNREEEDSEINITPMIFARENNANIIIKYNTDVAKLKMLLFSMNLNNSIE